MKLLWLGDGGDAQTGFARVSNAVLPELQRHGWQVAQLAINMIGDHLGPPPWPMYRASAGGDVLGIGRLREVYEREQPDLVCLLGDPWVVRMYLPELPTHAKVVAYLPVDAPNQYFAEALNRLDYAVAYTEFGARELRLGGYLGPIEVIPHGVDSDFFHPISQREARQALSLPEDALDAFIVGNVNRNQPRKRLDLMIQYFAAWWHRRGRPADARLLFHCALQDEGWNLLQLADYYGIANQIIATGSEQVRGYSSMERLRLVYNSLSLHATTTLGEGFGLTAAESMACGIANQLPGYAALAEWAEGAAYFVDCTSTVVAPGGINTLGGVADREQFITGLDMFYTLPGARTRYGHLAHTRMREPRFSWARIGAQFNTVFQRTLLS